VAPFSAFDTHLRRFFFVLSVDDFAKELGKLRGVLRFPRKRPSPIGADLRIALAVSDARHSKVHAHLVHSPLKFILRSLMISSGAPFGNADNMLGSPAHFVVLLYEFCPGALQTGHCSGAESPMCT
jgi:hypothetical protein